jgi:cyclomaltodextrinase / maltogenic alpha-amylase / neopullulanase
MTASLTDRQLALYAALAGLAVPDALAPDWAVDAVWYQIFPERFENGDPANDPTYETLEFGEDVPESWSVRSWTGDWYERSEWEQAMGPSFYHDGVFHRRYGGDLQGVLDRLDYLDSLGINAIYFNPLFWGRSLHKYDGNSFHHIDPHFGPDYGGPAPQVPTCPERP